MDRVYDDGFMSIEYNRMNCIYVVYWFDELGYMNSRKFMGYETLDEVLSAIKNSEI